MDISMKNIPSFTQLHASVKRFSNHFAEAIIHGFAVSNPSPYNPHPPFTPEQFERFIHNIAYAVSMLTILCLIAVAILSIPATGGASPAIFLALLAGPPLAGAALMTLTCMFRNASVRFQQFREFNKEFHDKTCKIRLLIKHYLSVKKLGELGEDPAKLADMEKKIRNHAPEIVKLECMAETYKHAYLQRKIDALEEENEETTPDVGKSAEIEKLKEERDTITPNNITSFIHALFLGQTDEYKKAFINDLKQFPFPLCENLTDVHELSHRLLATPIVPDYHADKKKEPDLLNSLIEKCLMASLESEREKLTKKLKGLNSYENKSVGIVTAVTSIIFPKIDIPHENHKTILDQLIEKLNPLEIDLEKLGIDLKEMGKKEMKGEMQRLDEEMQKIIGKVIKSLADIITPSNTAFQSASDFIDNEKFKQLFLLLDTITLGLTTFFVGIVSLIRTKIIPSLFGKEKVNPALKPDELLKLAKKTTLAKLKESKADCHNLPNSITKSLDNVDVDSLSNYLEVADDVVDRAVVVFKSGNQSINSWVYGVSQDTLHYEASLRNNKLEIYQNIQKKIIQLMGNSDNPQHIDLKARLKYWGQSAKEKVGKSRTDLSRQNPSDVTPHDKTQRDFILKQERFLKARIKHRDGNRDKQRGNSKRLGQEKSSSNKIGKRKLDNHT